ncbi:hypothetical protein [Streptomyces sp. MZ04]|uniref:hypothetical protein n=1 Tax=Streptomyces sp. MZ04 TaxID=2559236 RepID=UPI00107EB908|nr:hypothetical protein [Streptomyces sp. MZ04]TGB03321.1 hypothetical protein E2651_25460 [Streptomyces sp. MZ04]
MPAWLLTLTLAISVSGMQTWFKLVSREPDPATGSRHALTLDDAVFWIDWVVTAVSALFLFLLGAAQDNKPIGTSYVFAALVALVLGGMVLPYAFRILCYDGTGKIKSWVHVAIADAVGLLVLFACVAAGVKTYGA